MKFMTRLLISGRDILMTSFKYWNYRKAAVWGVTSLFLFHWSQKKTHWAWCVHFPLWKRNNLSRRYLFHHKMRLRLGISSMTWNPVTHPHTPDTHAHRHKVLYVITYFRLDLLSSECCHWGGACREFQEKRRQTPAFRSVASSAT